MADTKFDARVKVSQIIKNQIPEFVSSSEENFVEFLKQYYISQEYRGSSLDIGSNFDQYLKLDNLNHDTVSREYVLTQDVFYSDDEIYVDSTVGFPDEYGLLKINDEIITYTGKTSTSFTGAIRGFSGVESFDSEDRGQKNLVFKSSSVGIHSTNDKVLNLSNLFLKEFFKKLKYQFLPGLEEVDFASGLNLGTFIKESKSLFQSKGTVDSFKILFKVLYNVDAEIIDTEDFLIKSSSAEYIRRKVLFARLRSGENPIKIIGQTLISSDGTASAPISEIDYYPSTGGDDIYRISIFEGYDDRDLLIGSFKETPVSKVIGDVPAGSNTITVDSTVGLPSSGNVISGNNSISYAKKSVNQLFGCTGILENISDSDEVKSSDYVYSYEDGDVTKLVTFEVKNILSEFNFDSNYTLVEKNDPISINNLGEYVDDVGIDNTYKQFVFNSWIYNTASRFQIESSSSNTSHVLREYPNKNSLKVGDDIQIFYRGSIQPIGEATVLNVSINQSDFTKGNLTISDLVLNDPNINLSAGLNLDIRRVIKKAKISSTSIPLKYSDIMANIQNTYDEDSKNIYVATNSIPDYQINAEDISVEIQSLDEVSNNIITFSSETSLKFLLGDKVTYTHSADGNSISGLENNKEYFVKVQNQNTIKLYTSLSAVVTDTFLTLSTDSSTASNHKFTLSRLFSKEIVPSLSLRKFPLETSKNTRDKIKTTPNTTVATLINGVEVSTYKDADRVFYGPIQDVDVLDQGQNYDVVNPPQIQIDNPTGIGGTTCLVTPIISGSVESVLLDVKNVPVRKVSSVTISGGNGTGCVLEPVIENKHREIEFDATSSVNSITDSISFVDNHYFSDGQKVVYNKNNNDPLGIGTFGGSNLDQNRFLLNGGSYYVKYITSKSIGLYESLNDYVAGINTVGFTTTNAAGIHKIRTFDYDKVLADIRVIDSGSGYEYRSLTITAENRSTSISTTRSLINFKNHGFDDGSIVKYTSTSPISGLSNSQNYYLIKLDDDSFRLANNETDYSKKKYINFGSIGGNVDHTFNYSPITVDIKASYVNAGQTITATPVVRGGIIDIGINESGSRYGSEVLNYENPPQTLIKNGKGALVSPVIINGVIDSVTVLNGGSEYYSLPDLSINTKSGAGAKLKPIIDTSTGKLTGVFVIKGGIGYEQTATISVETVGNGCKINPRIRPLTINSNSRFGNETIKSIINTQDGTYTVLGYLDKLRESLKDNFGTENSGSEHSPIIGWAYDGNPIYGSFGYTNPNDATIVKRVESGYTLDSSKIYDRPSLANFAEGIFVEDYIFDDSGDLDEHNGRFTKTPDFPKGIYAYFSTIVPDPNIPGTFLPDFPYFIGDTYKSDLLDGVLDQNQENFDLQNSGLLRNTAPYRLGQKFSKNDYIDFEFVDRFDAATIDFSSKGDISSFSVDVDGFDYKVGDALTFDNSKVQGSGVSAEVSEIKGKDITTISYTEIKESNVVLEKESSGLRLHVNPFHSLNNQNYVKIDNESTNIPGLSGFHKINVEYNTSVLSEEIIINSGIVTDIFVSSIPKTISIGSTIGIGTENMEVLNVFSNSRIIRAKRSLSGIAHSVGSVVTYRPDSFTIPFVIDEIDSFKNKKVYFNPKQSVAKGLTIGVSSEISYTINNIENTISILNGSLYLPNHGFEHNEKVTFVRPSGANGFANVYSLTTNQFFQFLNSSESETVYINKKSDDVVGIMTLLNPDSELIWMSTGSDNYEYYLESQNNQITVDVSEINATVSVSTSHGLQKDDIVELNVIPNNNVGIGTSTSLKSIFNNNTQRILINPVGFNSSGINTTNNSITIPNNNFVTGDKVFYEANTAAAGLSLDSYYYILKLSDDVISLSETLYDATSKNLSVVSIGGTGGSSQKLSLVNPRINVIKNNNLVFDISDSSFANKTIKFFKDNNYVNEFISTSDESSFNVIGVGTPGQSGAKITLNYTNSIDYDLYYIVEDLVTGDFILPDKDVKSFSKISYIDSFYNDSFTVSSVGLTTFTVNLVGLPEVPQYTSSDVKSFEYLTNSKTATGPISKIRKVSPGFNYDSLPSFTGVQSDSGDGAGISLLSNTIGVPQSIDIVNTGFSFPTDKTLSPSGILPIVANLKENHQISDITITSGGSDYYSEPSIVLVDAGTRESVDTASFIVELDGSSVSRVTSVNATGLDLKKYELIPTNNTNGVLINTIEHQSGIVTCILSTPIGGFLTPPFAVNDQIFVEGIEKSGTSGDGFNSTDLGYRYFTVSEYQNTSPAKIVFDISKFTSDAGTPVTTQTFASVINRSKLPTFGVTLEESAFIPNEEILIDIGNGYVLSDNIIISSEANIAKIDGPDFIKVGYSIKGISSGSTAKINKITSLSGRFKIDPINTTSDGWRSNTGALSEDYQVLSDNDYYQKLAYSIKSPIPYETLIDPVNKLVHSTGLKNFADVGITSSVSIGLGDTTSTLSLVIDFNTDLRIDRIKDFDIVKDIDVILEPDLNPGSIGQFIKKSKYVEFQNKNLTDYFVCKSNRVLSIDNVENEFSSVTFGQEEYVDIITYPRFLKYSSFLVQSVGIGSTEQQFDDLVILNDNLNSYTINRGTLSNSDEIESYSEVGGFLDQFGNLSLRYEPEDPFERTYDIKVYRNNFDTGLSGIGTTSIGFVDITSNVKTVGVGSTSQIVGIATSSTEAILTEIIAIDSLTDKMNFFEVATVNDGTISNHAEYYFDTENLAGKSSEPFVSIGSTIESGTLKINLTNLKSNNIIYKAKTINIGPSSVGLGSTYRFLANGQPEGSERSAFLQSTHVETGNLSVGVGTIVASFDSNTVGSSKSLLKIKNIDSGNTSVHQILLLDDKTDTFIMPKFYVSMASTTGIGTFDSNIVGGNANLLFYPDFNANYEISIYSQVLYRELDIENITLDKEYGNIIESIKNSRFNAINGDGNDQLEFEMEYNGVPIFQKTFDPTDATTLNTSTGVFSISDHFFSNNESLTYTPRSTFLGVAATSIGIGTTSVGGTVFVGDFIAGLSTITGISSSLLEFFEVGQTVSGPSVPASTQIVSIGNTFQYFTGNIVGVGSTVITGIANTSIFKVNAGIFSGDGTSLGTIQSIGEETVTSNQTIDVGIGRTYYTDNVGLGISLSNVSTASTSRQSYICGLTTDVCPSNVFAIVSDPNTFKITGTNNSKSAFTFTNTGGGNAHSLTMNKNIEKTLINIDGIIQHPIAFSPISYTISDNITNSQEYIALSGISTVNPRDLIKIDEEYLEVTIVGLGTTASGPITRTGTIPLIKAKRGAVGSTASTHTSGSTAQLYKGSYNIVGNKLHFTSAPKGSGENDRENPSGIKFERSSFNGRVFLRQDYSKNIIYDDISSQFNGIGRTFTIKSSGQDVDYVEPGSGLLYVNEIFQTPSTSNNEGNNYDLNDAGSTTNIVFTGIKDPVDDDIITSSSDVNQNGVPRGGIIVSLGSTPGLGYAPLVGASVTAVVGAGGSFISVGLGTLDHQGSGYNGLVSIGVSVVDIEYDHKFVSAGVNSITDNNGGTHTATDATYNSRTGDLVLTIIDHGLTTSNTIGIATGGLVFTCSKDGHGSNHSYPRAISKTKLRRGQTGGDPIHNQQVAITATTPNTVQIDVGTGGGAGTGAVVSVDSIGVGGTLSFNVGSAGTDYVNPQIFVSDPSYSNLNAIGISRLGIGTTTDTGIGFAVNLEVGAASTTGIGSTYFEVTNFEVINNGYSFNRGDKFTIVGLVTDANLSEPIHNFELEVLETYHDNFALWQFGEMDFIDSIKLSQDGEKVRFPLLYNGDLLNFERDLSDPNSIPIDLKELLVIYINGILQIPGESYNFDGGTSIVFSSAPDPEDDVDIFFYRGTRGVDSKLETINEDIGIGDEIQIMRDPNFVLTRDQNPRTIFDIRESDLVETNIYIGPGISTEGDAQLSQFITNEKFVDIIPQKSDIIINGEEISRSRNRIASKVYPTSRLISDLSSSDNQIFVDEAQSFDYEENELSINIPEFDLIILEGVNKTPAQLQVVVSSASTISSINIISGGSGYEAGSVDVEFSNPPSGIGAGIGTIAQATATVSATGTVSSISVTNGGFGYSASNLPQVLVPLPANKVENVTSVKFVDGFSGIITGVTTTTTSGNPALEFKLYNEDDQFGTSLKVGYPFFVSDTNLGTGSTSFTGAGVTIGIGTTAFDNIYEVAEVSISPDNDKVGIVTCRATIDSLDKTISHELLFKLDGDNTNDQFGTDVAIGNDRIVVGAPYYHGTSNSPDDQGVAYIFDLSGNQLGIITTSDAIDFEYFGTSVAIGKTAGDNKIVIGKIDDSPNTPPSTTVPNAGSAYIYDLDGSFEAKIYASNLSANDRFGSEPGSIAIGHGRIVVGAPNANSGQGNAYIFDLSGNQLGIITASDSSTTADDFGRRVAIGNEKIVIGDYGNDPGGGANANALNAAGAAYIYDLDGSNEIKITASDGIGGDNFGDAVAVGSNRVVVGARRDGFDKGSVYVYDLSGTQLTKITASDGQAGDNFGFSVAIESNKIIVGSPLDDDNGSMSGALYVYDLDGTNESKITVINTADDQLARSVSAGLNKIVVGAPYEGSNDNGAVYVFDLNLTDSTKNYGNFSWGRFSNLTRESAQQFTISGNNVAGLSTYPQIQRRGYGLRDSGSYSN